MSLQILEPQICCSHGLVIASLKQGLLFNCGVVAEKRLVSVSNQLLIKLEQRDAILQITLCSLLIAGMKRHCGLCCSIQVILGYVVPCHQTFRCTIYIHIYIHLTVTTS